MTFIGCGITFKNAVCIYHEIIVNPLTATIKTDKTILGDALLEHSLIAGEEGAYGLYVKFVNGIRADYDLDGAYWGFNKGGEYMMTGVDGTTIADGDKYELVWTKG